MAFKKTILIDFDGVLHSYMSKWEGPEVVPDPPVDGAIDWLRELIVDERFDPQIYSSRSKYAAGAVAMQSWLMEHGMDAAEVKQIPFPTEKPAAWLTIDDRAWTFEGKFPSLEAMDVFKPWNRK